MLVKELEEIQRFHYFEWRKCCRRGLS